MKFMKLGSKPDCFQTDGKNSRYVASELASDITLNVGDVKFYLHKFPLLSKSANLQKIVTASSDEESDEVFISNIPGGAEAFEICAKFCYGMTVTLNAHNVVMARCAAEYLEMHESVEKGNLIYKVDVFLTSSVFRSWKDSIIVLQTTKSLSPVPEELKLVGRCVEAVANKACVDPSRVDWSYTYNRKKLSEDQNGSDPGWNGAVVRRAVPRDWWVEDICELEVDLYRRVLASIKSRATVSSEVIGEALKAYAHRRLPGFGKGTIQCGGDAANHRATVDSIVWLLPSEKGGATCSFLLRMLKAAIVVGSGEAVRDELVRRVGQQLEAASVGDILIRAVPEDVGALVYDVGVVRRILDEFLRQEEDGGEEYPNGGEIELLGDGDKARKRRDGILSDASKLMVAKLIDGYLVEIAKDPNLPLSTFVDLAEMVSGIPRPSHDGIYRAIDTFLKEHPGMSKSERKRVCKMMDCRKLSGEACGHAVQNERLPLRVVVQVLFFEQVRGAASSGSSTPDLPKSIKDLNNASHGSSRSANTNNTNTEDEWDALASADELRALRGELASLRLAADRNAPSARAKMGGVLNSKKIFARLWSGKTAAQPEIHSGSDSSESLASAVPEETKSTPSRNHRHSVS